MKTQRHKGKAFELKVCRFVNSICPQIGAERTAPMQAGVGGSSRYVDVALKSRSKGVAGFECKHHKRVPVNKLVRELKFETDDGWMVPMAWQDNHGVPMVTMPLRDFLLILGM